MKCLTCKTTSSLSKERTSNLIFCGKKCQKEHYIGLKTFVYDYETKGPILVKDDPNIVGLISNDLQVFEITRDQAKELKTIDDMLQDVRNTDTPIKIDVKGEILQIVVSYLKLGNRVNIIEYSKDSDKIIQLFQLANYLNYEYLINNEFIEESSLTLIHLSKLKPERFNYFYRTFIKNYVDKFEIIKNPSTFGALENACNNENVLLVELILEKSKLEITHQILIYLIKLNNAEVLEKHILNSMIDLGINNQELLGYANYENYLESLKVLIKIGSDYGVDVTVKNNIIIKTQIGNGNMDIVKLLLATKKINIDKGIIDNAIMYQRHEIFKLLFNSIHNQHDTLITSIRYNNYEAFNKIRSIYNDLSDQHYLACVKYGRYDMFKDLAINMDTEILQKCFKEACNLGLKNFVKFILKTFPNNEYDYEYGKKRAEANEHYEMVEYLKSLTSNKRIKN
jgi:hypothetical protein